jgi:hypothetical protein
MRIFTPSRAPYGRALKHDELQFLDQGGGLE